MADDAQRRDGYMCKVGVSGNCCSSDARRSLQVSSTFQFMFRFPITGSEDLGRAIDNSQILPSLLAIYMTEVGVGAKMVCCKKIEKAFE